MASVDAPVADVAGPQLAHAVGPAAAPVWTTTCGIAVPVGA